MNIFSLLYNELLYRPLFNGLVLLYAILPAQDLGIAIVLFTAAVRLVLTPFLYKTLRSQLEMARIQPEIRRIQERFKNNREEQGKALMALYAEHRVNPFSGCLGMIVQIMVFIPLFQVFQNGLDGSQLGLLYGWVPNPGTLNLISLGFLDLSRRSIPLGVFAAFTQYLQTRLAATPPPGAEEQQMARMMRIQTTYLFPLLVLFWSSTLASAFALYWTTLNVFGILQERIMKRWIPKA